MAELGLDLVAAPPPASEPPPAPAPPPPCPARDPESGRCYPSADAADLAWLGRAAVAQPVAFDEDDDEEGLEAAAPDSFWRTLGERLRSLAVRRSDGKPVAVPEEEIEVLFATRFPLPIESYDRERLHDSFLARRGKNSRRALREQAPPEPPPGLVAAVLAAVRGWPPKAV